MEPYNFKIENVVSTIKLSDHFDLINIKSILDGAEYNKQKFPGLIYRINEPRAVFLLFNSGKVVCTVNQLKTQKMRLINFTENSLNLEWMYKAVMRYLCRILWHLLELGIF